MAKPRRSPLTRATIVAAAAAIIEERGADKLSMRALGAALGVEAMAVYNHFENRDAVLDGVVEALFASVESPPKRGPWDKRLRSVARGLRAAAVQQPRAFQLAMTRPAKPVAALPIIEAVLSALSDAGLPPRAIGPAYLGLAAFFRGAILNEAERAAECAPAPPSPAAMEPFPLTAAFYGSPQRSQPDAAFDAALDLWIEGVRARAQQR